MNIPDTKINVKKYMQIYDHGGRALRDAIEITDTQDIETLKSMLPENTLGFETYELTEFIHGDEILQSKPRNRQKYVKKGKLMSIDKAIEIYGKKEYMESLKTRGYQHIVAIKELVNFLPYKSDVVILEEGFDVEHLDRLTHRKLK